MGQKAAGKRGSIEERFRDFHRDNPQVWELFEQYTLLLIDSGRKRGSADRVAHRIRWDVDIRTTAADYKLNNDFVALYARMFRDAHPQHASFFAYRALRATSSEEAA